MFGANPSKSAETIEMITRVFATRARGRDDYTVVYGHGPVSRTKKTANYVLGFSVRDWTLVVCPIALSGEAMGDVAILRVKDRITIRKMGESSIYLNAPVLPQALEITVPPSSPDAGERDGLRAVNQYEAAANFMSFIKSV